jgi:hypothetical protein
MTKTKSITTKPTQLKKRFFVFFACFAVWLVWATINEIKERDLLPKRIDVFEVGSPALVGEVTIVGYLRYDPTTTNGLHYYLVLPDGRILVIDSTVKSFLPGYADKQVEVSGTVIPLPETNLSGLILPIKIKAI